MVMRKIFKILFWCYSTRHSWNHWCVWQVHHPCLSGLAKKVVDMCGDLREWQWTHQHLSLAVVKGNTASILACVHVWSNFSYSQCTNQYICLPLAFVQCTAIAFWMFLLSISFVDPLCNFSSNDHLLATLRNFIFSYVFKDNILCFCFRNKFKLQCMLFKQCYLCFLVFVFHVPITSLR